jgi:adenosine deaminase
MNDPHVHFTGSLPVDFLLKALDGSSTRFRGGRVTSAPRLLHVVSNCLRDENRHTQRGGLRSLFSTDWRANHRVFGELYECLQHISRTRYGPDRAALYRDGTKAISLWHGRQKVERIELIVGARTDAEQSIQRVEQTLVGARAAEEDGGAKVDLRITLIRRSDGKRNIDPDELAKLAQFLDKRPELAERVAGFDVSGPETPQTQRQTVYYLDALHGLCDPDKISVHIGENICAPAEGTLEVAAELLRRHVKHLVHGLLFWLPRSTVGIEGKENTKRLTLLREFGSRGARIDVCPTAARLFSPLRSDLSDHLEDMKKLGLEIGICSDNPTIFGTSAPFENRMADPVKAS